MGRPHILMQKPRYHEHFDHKPKLLVDHRFQDNSLTKFDYWPCHYFGFTLTCWSSQVWLGNSKLFWGHSIASLTILDNLVRVDLIAIDYRFWHGCFDFEFGKSIWVMCSLFTLKIWYNNKKIWPKGFPHLGVFPWHPLNLVFSLSWLVFCILFYVVSNFNVNTING